MSWTARRRFWQATAVLRQGDGFSVRLDARPLQTPAKAPLILPTAALAAAIAAEWDAVEGEVRPERLPLTRAANTAIDRVMPDPGRAVAAIAAYGNTDLLCHRAEAPEGLRARQAAAWDPWLDWAAQALSAPLVAVSGLMPRQQPAASLAALQSAVAAEDAFALTALQELVVLSGSLVLGLAVARGALTGAAAWPISRIDEDWQAEHWGLDSEAEAAGERKRLDFLTAEMLLRLLSAVALTPRALILTPDGRRRRAA